VLIALNGLIGQVSRTEVLTICIALPLTLFTAPLTRFKFRRMFAHFRWWGESVIIVGSGRQARLVFEFLERQLQRGLKPLGIVDSDPNAYWLSD
jgi:FlaA1/EpsC-like NDP-sugar epimerase